MNAIPAKVKSQRSEPTNSPNEVRTAYPYFHEKRTKNAAGVPFVKKDGTPNPRYSATFMFPKLSNDASQCANYMFLWGLAQEAAKKMWPQNVDAAGNWVWPTGAQYAVKDGDVPFVSKPKPGQPLLSAEEIAKKNEWRKGYWIVEAENFLDPGPRIAKIINGVAADLPAKILNGVEQYKGGDFGYVNIHAYAYQNETFGVNFGFDGFCFTREGERIGGAGGPKTTAQMFGSLAPVASAAPGMPPVPGAPVAPAAPGATLPPVAPPPVAPAAPVAPAPAPQYAPNPPGVPAAPTGYGAPPMPPVASVVSAPGLPPFPGR